MKVKFVGCEALNVTLDTYKKSIGAIRETMIMVADGRMDNPAKIATSSDKGDVTISMLAAELAPYVSASKSFIELGGEHYTGSLSSLLIVDRTEDDFVTFMDCGAVTAIRTGIINTLLASATQPKDPMTSTVIGSGAVAESTIVSLLLDQTTIKKLYIISQRKRTELQAFLDDLSRLFPATSFEIVDTESGFEDAVRASEFVFGCAGHGPEPLQADWLKPGSSVIAAGGGISKSVYAANFPIVTTNIPQMGMFKDASAAEGISFDIRGELANYISDGGSGRKSQEEIIIGYNTGIAASDLPVARILLSSADPEHVFESEKFLGEREDLKLVPVN